MRNGRHSGCDSSSPDVYAIHRSTIISSYPEKSGHLTGMVKFIRSEIEREARSLRPSKQELFDLLAYIDACMVPVDRFDAECARRIAAEPETAA